MVQSTDCRFGLVIVAVCGLTAGCGTGSATIVGEVLVDNQKLTNGVISFLSADGTGNPSTAIIQNGQYRLQVVPGKYLVQISASRVTRRQPAHVGPGAPLVDITEEMLPEKYNVRTELTFDVQSGTNTKNWSLSTQN